MDITLIKATVEDSGELYDLQIKSFKALLEKYQDYDYSPGAEKIDRTVQRLEEPFTDYYFISLDGTNVGGLRICNFGELCKLKQIYILPEYQNNGYAQTAIRLGESLHPEAKRWQVDTILQENKLCYLYEKMGYKKTGRIDNIKAGMDIVYYEKEE